MSWNFVNFALFLFTKSHPHGCVSWNWWSQSCYDRFRWSHPHGCVSWNRAKIERANEKCVTPSRVCELKSGSFWDLSSDKRSHPHGCVSWNCNYIRRVKLMIKSHPHGCVSWNVIIPSTWNMIFCHTLTGVWVEICVMLFSFLSLKSHTLTGVWVEICAWWWIALLLWVTPSRVCELKFIMPLHTPSETRHTLTGVWVEMLLKCLIGTVCGSHPHGCVSWNFRPFLFLWKCEVTPSRVCELKCIWPCAHTWDTQSHPHGCVSWNAAVES